jgi:23S rRNA pseudouridine2605 synthase
MTFDEHELSTEGVRLQKVMAAAGVGSRRVSEDLITAGRVRVNGEIVRELGRRVNPETDEIAVDNVAVQLDTTKRYVMLNKPVGVVSSMKDGRGRPDLTQFTEGYEDRLFNVGRLDAETSGLLLLTNDGELAHVLAHPSFGVDKTYIAKVSGRVTPQTIATLRRGVELEDGVIAADAARILAGQPGGSHSTLVEITLHSGRNRIVRRMLDAVGHPVQELVRRQFGPLHLGSLPSGRTRYLTKDELGALLTIARKAQKAQAEGGTDAAAAAPQREKRPARAEHAPHAERAPRDHAPRDRDRAPREHSERGGHDRPRREGQDRDRERGDYERPRREGQDRDRERGDYERPRREGQDRGGYDRPRRENQDRDRSSRNPQDRDRSDRDRQDRDRSSRDPQGRDRQDRDPQGYGTRDRRDERDASRGSAARSSRDAGDAARDQRPGRAQRDQSARRTPSSGPRQGGQRRNPGRPSSGGSDR